MDGDSHGAGGRGAEGSERKRGTVLRRVAQEATRRHERSGRARSESLRRNLRKLRAQRCGRRRDARREERGLRDARAREAEKLRLPPGCEARGRGMGGGFKGGVGNAKSRTAAGSDETGSPRPTMRPSLAPRSANFALQFDGQGGWTSNARLIRGAMLAEHEQMRGDFVQRTFDNQIEISAAMSSPVTPLPIPC